MEDCKAVQKQMLSSIFDPLSSRTLPHPHTQYEPVDNAQPMSSRNPLASTGETVEGVVHLRLGHEHRRAEANHVAVQPAEADE